MTSWDGARIIYDDKIVNLTTGETLDLSRIIAKNPSAGGGLVRWHPQGKAVLLGGKLVQPETGSLIVLVTEIAPYWGGWSHDGQKLTFVGWNNFLSLSDGQVIGYQTRLFLFRRALPGPSWLYHPHALILDPGAAIFAGVFAADQIYCCACSF